MEKSGNLFKTSTLSLVVFLALTLFTLSAFAQNTASQENDYNLQEAEHADNQTVEPYEEPAWHVGAGIDWNSKYVWRGTKVSDDNVMQPWIFGSVKGLSVELWGNVENNHTRPVNVEGEFSEVDLTVDYTHSFGPVDLAVGYILYFMRDLESRTWESWRYNSLTIGGAPVLYFLDSIEERVVQHDEWYVTQEVYVKGRFTQEVTEAMDLAIELAAFYDFDEDNRATLRWGPDNDKDRVIEQLPDNTRLYYYARLFGLIDVADHVTVIPSILLHYTDESRGYEGWGSIIFGLSADIQVNDYVTITPSLNYSWAVDDSEKEIYGWDYEYWYLPANWSGVDNIQVIGHEDIYKDELWGGISVSAVY